jgi:hypothetical protein
LFSAGVRVADKSHADGQVFGFLREQIEHEEDGEHGSHAGEAEDTQYGDGVAALAGGVAAAIEEYEVAEGADVAGTGLDEGEPHIAWLIVDAEEVF